MRLADLQAAYRGYLLSGDGAALAPAIVADSFDGAERLAIYRNNFLISLGEALKANFPVTLQLLGAEFFEQAARRFVLSHPPQRPCLFEYGAGFADHLRDLPHMATRPYIVDMTRFEFARIAAYNAPAEPAVAPESLVGLTPEQLEALPIRRARHALVLAVRAPVLALWQTHQEAEPDFGAIDMTPRSQALLVCRPDQALMYQELDLSTSAFLLAAESETSLGIAAARCGATDDATLGRIIALALQLKLLTPGS
ncbi:MAG TPA: DNA-binding domain-containing protein [Dongiaceae bacterium]|nr:DNA-binding domain-containing protein [Dongiaceae bacterium]